MCSSGDSTLKASEQSQAAFSSTLRDSFGTAFAAKQDILGKLNAKLTDMLNNPHGFDPKTLALMKSGAADAVARGTDAAHTAANAYFATHGGPTLGSGVEAQVHGGIAASGAAEGARESSNIDIQSGLLQNENYWKAISGLSGVANAENPEGLASAEVGSANATSDLGKSFLASKQADWQNTFGIIKGVAGLASAGLGFAGVGVPGANSGPSSAPPPGLNDPGFGGF
ncbi:MAG TPA: hypothetical protein VHW72_15025 [Candidatus Angelobacter sp.]|jgi:hypothetical protein|nr:hypothetical protein [Candidatus Angelobacter sp.]